MLYVTTRDDRDAYTSHKAVCENVGPDGGRYVPFSMPTFTQDEIAVWQDKLFSQGVAEILNLFFPSRLSGWDVDFYIGRNIVHLQQMNHRIVIAELWRNLEGNYDYIEKCLAKAIFGDVPPVISHWMKVAVRIAILFGIYGEMRRNGVIQQNEIFDVSVLSGDFTEPMVIYYAKKLGLPVGCIICTCTDNSSVWDFLQRGTFSPIGATKDLQLGLEQLILDIFDVSKVDQFMRCCQNGLSFSLDEEQLPLFNASFFSTVAGDNRATSTINSLFRTNRYVADPRTALCFGGLQDYRARTGESKLTLLLSEQTPLDFADEIAKNIGINVIELEQLINS